MTRGNASTCFGSRSSSVRAAFKTAPSVPTGLHVGSTRWTFHQALGNYNVKDVRVVGTSALRDASNGAAFAEAVRSQFGWDLGIIGGEEEADWIFRGVAQTLTDALERVLIMDIGGGSVEFVVAERTDAGTWQSKAALSLDAGVARLEEREAHRPARVGWRGALPSVLG